MEENKIESISFKDKYIKNYITKHLNAVLLKQHIQTLKMSIANIAEVLKAALTKYEQAEKKEVIVAVGNTGSGKSTMLTSLIYGTDFLKEDKKPYYIMVPQQGGKEKKKKKSKTVVVQKTDKLEFLAGKFAIGHEDNESKTFIPHFDTAADLDIVYADIAGLKDVNDKIIDVLNNFLTKSLFVRAQSVRFIITITLDQVNEERGKMVRDQIETVR